MKRNNWLLLTNCCLCDYHSKVRVICENRPLYDHFCNHPDIKRIEFEELPLVPHPEGNGLYIGMTSFIPSWCPIKNERSNQ